MNIYIIYILDQEVHITIKYIVVWSKKKMFLKQIFFPKESHQSIKLHVSDKLLLPKLRLNKYIYIVFCSSVNQQELPRIEMDP